MGIVLGWLVLGTGLVVAAVAVVLYRRKIAAWYTLRIVAMALIMVGAALAFSLTIGDRGGGTAHL